MATRSFFVTQLFRQISKLLTHDMLCICYSLHLTVSISLSTATGASVYKIGCFIVPGIFATSEILRYFQISHRLQAAACSLTPLLRSSCVDWLTTFVNMSLGLKIFMVYPYLLICSFLLILPIFWNRMFLTISLVVLIDFYWNR